MVSLTGSLPKVLTDHQIASMHQAALDVIEHIGLAVSHPHLLAALAGQSGVDIREGRVYVCAPLVDDIVTETCRRARANAPSDGQGVRILTTGHASHILDPYTRTMREITTADLEEAARLAEALRGRGVLGGAPGFPSDTPPHLRQIKQFKITLENCRSRGHPGPDLIPEAELIREMCRVVGADFHTGVHVISPLRLEGNELDIAMHFAADGLSVPVGTMPTAGVTAPIRLPALFVQAMAEAIGGCAILRLAGLEHASFWVNAYPADMRSLNLVYGSPEHILCDLMQLAINGWYGLATAAKGLITMAKEPDMQAATDGAMHTAALMLAGATTISGAGALSHDEAYSPEKLMIDCEIVEYVQRLLRGFPFELSPALEEEIAQGIAAGGFAGLESTVRSYRDVYWLPRLFTHDLLGQWQREGAPSLRDRARAAMEEAVRGYDYALPAEQQSELDRIYTWAEAHLMSRVQQ